MHMKEVESITGVRNELNAARSRGELIGLVPTMGALHEGHVQLIRRIRDQVSYVVVSVFVNPTQFGPNEDYSRYPRTTVHDRAVCEGEGVQLMFSPEAAAMYPVEPAIGFRIDRLADHLCGKSRPGHFNGVLQVVNKLLNIIQPDVAIFGQKDIQQYILIDRMVQEFNHPVRLVMGDTVREADGLAKSSRNIYLCDEERKRAPMLWQALNAIATGLTGNPGQKADGLIKAQAARLQANNLKIDYLSVANFSDLQIVNEVVPGRKYIVAGAVYNGTTRLIDNIITDFSPATQV
jgi:pantoate--beta-alanine ligase